MSMVVADRPDLLAKAVQMRVHGAPHKAIAAALSCSAHTSKRHMKRLGVKRDRAINHRIVALYSAGIPVQEIADKAGRSRSTVLRVARAAGLPKRQDQ